MLKVPTVSGSQESAREVLVPKQTCRESPKRSQHGSLLAVTACAPAGQPALCAPALGPRSLEASPRPPSAPVSGTHASRRSGRRGPLAGDPEGPVSSVEVEGEPPALTDECGGGGSARRVLSALRPELVGPSSRPVSVGGAVIRVLRLTAPERRGASAPVPGAREALGLGQRPDPALHSLPRGGSPEGCPPSGPSHLRTQPVQVLASPPPQ